MTIASAFNDIAVAQGGTAAKSGAITAAIDALNDALAGSDQPQAKTIEQAVRLLGEHIGGGGGGTHKAYLVNSGDPSALLEGISVKDWNDNSVNVYDTQIEGPGGALTVKCFDAADGTQYQIEKTTTPHITGAECTTYADQKQIFLPFDSGIAYYTGVSADVLVMVTL